nr:DEAD/DEAH box helicase [uncultured Oscillibacter sp.]
MPARPYQQECLDVIQQQPPGSYLCNLATGLGKTWIFTHIPRQGRVLVLAHREELVRQPAKYYDCPVGFEIAKDTSNGEEVVIASVQSLVRRLERFAPNDFDMLITDECHHAAANTYRKIYDYFHPRLHLGFTATVMRGDKVRLDDVFQKIIFQRDLRWGIQNKYLCDILCKRVDIGYDLRAVHTRNGDYAPGELDEAMEGTADAIAQTYREHAAGATLIFAVSVHQAEEIAGRIKGAVVVTGETKDRAAIIEAFTAGEIPCIVNCMVFTEGTDIPRVETVIVARPTQSESLYAQMVGRGLRLYPSKERLVLIDCVGITGKASLCTAPSLLGLDLTNIPARKINEVQGDLFDLPLKIAAAGDCPESWIKNVEIVDLWAQEQKYNTHNINFFKMPDGEMVVSLAEGKSLTIPCPNSLGLVHMSDGSQVGMQEAIDRVYLELLNDYADCRQLWDLESVRRWGKAPATDKQVSIIQRRCKGFDTTGLSKGDASQILNRLFNAPKKKGRSA